MTEIKQIRERNKNKKNGVSLKLGNKELIQF